MGWRCPQCRESFGLGGVEAHLREFHLSPLTLHSWSCSRCLFSATSFEALAGHCLTLEHRIGDARVELRQFDIARALECLDSIQESMLGESVRGHLGFDCAKDTRPSEVSLEQERTFASPLKRSISETLLTSDYVASEERPPSGTHGSVWEMEEAGIMKPPYSNEISPKPRKTRDRKPKPAQKWLESAAIVQPGDVQPVPCPSDRECRDRQDDPTNQDPSEEESINVTLDECSEENGKAARRDDKAGTPTKCSTTNLIWKTEGVVLSNKAWKHPLNEFFVKGRFHGPPDPRTGLAVCKLCWHEYGGSDAGKVVVRGHSTTNYKHHLLRTHKDAAEKVRGDLDRSALAWSKRRHIP